MQKEVLVSVLCLAYNHERFIRQTLEGFVMQKTDFAFEVLINDDASTDNTAKIIREYEEKYPEIIKPVYQSENQYSQGIPIMRTHFFPKAQGKYFAICEGDDYWTDPLKLQKQVDFLENNPEYAICVHKATLRNFSTGQDVEFPNIKQDRDYATEEIIKAGGGVFSTNSAVIKKEVLTARPECFKAKGFGDFQLFIYGSICGKCRCLADNMSVYNYLTGGSWSSVTLFDKQKKLFHYEQLKNMLERINIYYDYRYDSVIKEELNRIEFNVILLNNDKRIKEKRFSKHYARYKKMEMRKRLREKLPFLVKIKRKILK